MQRAKRRDNKKRLLYLGESQQKDGKYRYTYYVNGKQKCIYSWRLVESDPVPYGKRYSAALRTQEDAIQNARDRELDFTNKGTFTEFANDVIEEKKRKLASSSISQKYVALKHLQNTAIANKPIAEITRRDMRSTFVKLANDGYTYQPLHQMLVLSNQTFNLAIEYGVIENNPIRFHTSDFVSNEHRTRKALTMQQVYQYLEYIKSSKEYSFYYDIINVLFNTGLRAGEVCGLTLKDIDFENRTLSVNKQIRYEYEFKTQYITKPKTKTSIRTVPMNDTCIESIKRQINRNKNLNEFTLCGYSNFIFRNQHDGVYSSESLCRAFNKIWNSFSKVCDEDFPTVTAHVCRHTFCSIMAYGGYNLKMLQYIMGHSTIEMTLNVYTHIQTEEFIRQKFPDIYQHPTK